MINKIGIKFLNVIRYVLRNDYFYISVYRNKVVMMYDKDNVSDENAFNIKKELEVKGSFRKKYNIIKEVAGKNELSVKAFTLKDKIELGKTRKRYKRLARQKRNSLSLT